MPVWYLHIYMMLNEHAFLIAGFPTSASVEAETSNLGKQVQDYERIKYHHDYMQQMQLAMRLALNLMQHPNRHNANQVTCWKYHNLISEPMHRFCSYP